MTRPAALVLSVLALVACGRERFESHARSEPESATYRRMAQPFLDKVEPILLTADSVELISLDPFRAEGGSDASLDGRTPLGRTLLSAEGTRVLAAALRRSAERSRGTGGCFQPRHAIVARKGSTTLELLVCFECWQARGSLDGQRLFTALDREGEADFDRLLTAAHVPLAPKPRDTSSAGTR